MRRRYTRRRRRRTRRGGSYYRLNKGPMIFTQSSKTWGGGGDTRFMPMQPLTTAMRGFGHSIANFANDLQGHYHSTDPSPLAQPLRVK